MNLKNNLFAIIKTTAITALLAISFTSCAPKIQHYAAYNDLLNTGQFKESVGIIKDNEENYGSKSKLLYMLDMGLAYHYAGDYIKSIKYLAEAEELIDILYTKSLANEAAAYLTNDNILEYDGENFEKVLINIFQALNYSMLWKTDDALVEVRKVDHKLTVLNDEYEQKNQYKEDAFARYLSGFLYERNREINDAFIAYRKSLETYITYRHDYKTQIPLLLETDLLRSADALHLSDEVTTYSQKFKTSSWDNYKVRKEQAELVIFSYTGLSPVKIDEYIDATIPDGQGKTYLLRIAFPKFVTRPTQITGCEAIVSNITYPCNIMEDIESIALKDLKDRIARISAKAITRAGVKYLAARKIRNEVDSLNNPLTGLLAEVATDLYAIASEKADKRSWRTLPAKIQMARIPLEPGNYSVTVRYFDENGQTITTKNHNVNLQKRKTNIITTRLIQ